MKTFKKLSIILTVGLGIMCTNSCTDYLDVSDALAAELTIEEVFNNTSYARRFHRYIYSGIPNVSHIILDDGNNQTTGLDNPWSAMCDELKNGQGNVAQTPVTGYHAGSASFGRWSLYQQIRQANQFLTYAHEIPRQGNVTDFIDAAELASLKNEARFLRAYYHFLLFELYGPIPIMLDIADPSAADLDYYRNSVDEVIEFIDSELRACYSELPEKELRPDGSFNESRAAAPTKGAALAILAKLHIYAASPLLNGGYPEAVALRDNQGKQLFPERDDRKWDRALEALEQFIEYAESRYSLYTVNDSEGKIDPDQSLYQLFQQSIDNPEAIWQTSKCPWGDLGNQVGREIRCTPRTVNGFANVAILQEAIDDFFMSDGKSIEESSLYREEGIAEDGIPNMYKNREPRFYQDVTYAGKTWHVTGESIFFHKGMGDDNSHADRSYTGYLLYKGMNRTVRNQGSNPRSQYRAAMIFRLADFYLLYAEVLNQINPSDSRIIEYVDRFRERAGIPSLKVSKPEIIGNQALQEEAIRKERRIELFAEGQRYFDVRRWMCAEEESYKQGGPVHGMDMNATTLEDFIANRVVFETRIFERRMYLYPLPLDEIQKSTKLLQNPGW